MWSSASFTEVQSNWQGMKWAILVSQLAMMYNEPKNLFTKGQILLVSQIMAQGTKVNVCEILITKVDILSFVTPKYRILVPAIGLIYILQLGTLDQSVFLPVLGLTPFSLYHPSGHALNQISTNLLWYSLLFHLHLVPKLMHTSRRDLVFIELPHEVLPQISIGLRSGNCAHHFKTLMLFYLNHFEAF